jgi:hypothetical protein
MKECDQAYVLQMGAQTQTAAQESCKLGDN